MKNKYEIRGDVTAIFLNRRDGSVLEAVIDTADLDKVNEFDGKWYAHWNKCTKSFYAYGNLKVEPGKYTTLILHAHITNLPKGMVIDHINHDTLDNRRDNLRVVTQAENMQNKRTYRNNKTSGVRGVSWHKHTAKWCVQIMVNKKPKYIGEFTTVQEAERAAIEARTQHMPFSQEALQQGCF